MNGLPGDSSTLEQRHPEPVQVVRGGERAFVWSASLGSDIAVRLSAGGHRCDDGPGYAG